MKMFRKTLSLLLIVCMVMGMVCISYADEVTLPGKLLNLDISQYSKVTSGTNGSDLADSGIKNTGTSTTANIDWISADHQTTVKSSFENANNGITEYLDFTMKYANYADRCWRRVVKDSIWETQGNTISLWIDVSKDTSNFRNFLSYHAKYTEGNVRLGLWQTTDNNLWNTDSNKTNGIDISNYGGWKHIVITNPLYDEDTSKKTMDIYINGVKAKSVEITKPSGDLQYVGLYFAGAPDPVTTSAYTMPANCKYGNVAVYDGKLSDAQIAKIYEDEKNLYTEAVPELLFDMDISGFNPSFTTKDRGIKNAVTDSKAEIELCDGVRTLSTGTYNSGVFNKGSYPNTKAEIIPYVELSTSGYTTVSSSTPATARMFIDSSDWTSKSYTTELWMKSKDPSGNNNAHYATLFYLYGGMDTSDRNTNGGNLVTGNGTCDGSTDIVKFNRSSVDKWYLGTNDKAQKILADTGWMHVTITRKIDLLNNKAIHEGYINGVKVFTSADKIGQSTNANTATTLGTVGSSGLVVGKLTAPGTHIIQYVNSSVCIADVKVYSTVLKDTEIANHYNTELATYTPAEINITFKNSAGNEITTLDTIDNTTGEDTVTMNYTENVLSDDVWMVAGCYDADGNLLDYKEVTDITSGTLDITVPKGTDSIRVFTWKKSIYMPLRTAAIITKTPTVTE